MSTEWDSLINDLAVLNGTGDKDQEYKDLCSGTALTCLWSILEGDLKPSAVNLHRIRELIKEHSPEYYEEAVVPVMKEKELARIVAEVKTKAKTIPEMVIADLKAEGWTTDGVVLFPPKEPKKPKCSCGLYQTCDICKKYQER